MFIHTVYFWLNAHMLTSNYKFYGSLGTIPVFAINAMSFIVSASLIAALMAGTASADTLREALVSAYASNPTLAGQRETLKATDATVASPG